MGNKRTSLAFTKLLTRSLQIGSCFDILELKDNSSYAIQITAATMLLKKIDDTLKAHVKHNASHIISKDDLKLLKEQLPLMASMQEQLGKLKAHDELHEHLVLIDDIQANLHKIISCVDSTKEKVQVLQQDIVNESSNAFFYSN